MRRTLSGCCARAASGHRTAAPPKNDMNSRRLIASPDAQTRKGSNSRRFSGRACLTTADVRFGRKFFARKSDAKCLARRKGFEPLTPRFEVRRLPDAVVIAWRLTTSFLL